MRILIGMPFKEVNSGYIRFEVWALRFPQTRGTFSGVPDQPRMQRLSLQKRMAAKIAAGGAIIMGSPNTPLYTTPLNSLLN